MSDELTKRKILDAGKFLDEPELIVAKRQFCRHVYVEVDVDARTVTCRECEAPADPILTLQRFAKDFEGAAGWLVVKRQERNAVEKEIVDLRKTRQKLKAQVKRAQERLVQLSDEFGLRMKSKRLATEPPALDPRSEKTEA